MSVLSIQNQFLKASFATLGAELQSLKKIKNNEELIWQANAEYWPRHAPILFPIVGRLKDNAYTYKGVKYEMNQHGFARDSEFKVDHHTETEIVFLLTENKNTLVQYPFNFEFRVIYKLTDSVLSQEFIVKNTGIAQQFCSFGGHPAFNADPIDAHQLNFSPVNSNQILFLLKDGSICTSGNHFEMNTLELNETIFDEDALIFEKTTDLTITLKRNDTSILEITTCDMPYLGIWSKPKAPFVCIEPWQGWADLDTHTGEIELKSGIVAIEAGKKCSRKFEIRVF